MTVTVARTIALSRRFPNTEIAPDATFNNSFRSTFRCAPSVTPDSIHRTRPLKTFPASPASMFHLTMPNTTEARRVPPTDASPVMHLCDAASRARFRRALAELTADTRNATSAIRPVRPRTDAIFHRAVCATSKPIPIAARRRLRRLFKSISATPTTAQIKI